jgi:hypothetical protein
MVKTRFQVKGLDIVSRNFEEMARTSEPSVDGFLNVLGRTTVDLLRANTPVETGKLRDSWRFSVTKGGGQGKVRCVVSDDQEFKLRLITFGTRYIQPDPFVDRVGVIMQSFVANLLGQGFDERGHKWYRESGFTNNLKRANIGKIPGAGTGTNYNKRRSTGSFGLKRPSKGFKTLSRRVGRKSRRVSGL